MRWGMIKKRDHYLELALEQDDSMLAVQLTRAKQQVDQKHFSAALKTLAELQEFYPKHHTIISPIKASLHSLKSLGKAINTTTNPTESKTYFGARIR